MSIRVFAASAAIVLLATASASSMHAQAGPDVVHLEQRVQALEDRVGRSEEAAAGAGVILFVIACLCALWAQNTQRSAWLWFFLGLFFHVITLVVLLVKNSRNRDFHQTV